MLLVAIVNQLFGILTLLGQIIIVVILFLLFVQKSNLSRKVLKIFYKNALFFAFIIALAATLGSLFYSEIAGYEPCKLCWFQRVFMFPQVILLGMGIKNKDKYLANCSLALSFLGALIAFYHSLLQFNLTQSLPCSALISSVSCSQRFVVELGYITIPIMTLTAFLLIISLLLIQKITKN